MGAWGLPIWLVTADGILARAGIGIRTAAPVELSANVREYGCEVTWRNADLSRGSVEPESVPGGMRTCPTWSGAVAMGATEPGYDTALTVVGQLVARLTSTMKRDDPDW